MLSKYWNKKYHPNQKGSGTNKTKEGGGIKKCENKNRQAMKLKKRRGVKQNNTKGNKMTA